MPRTRNRKRRFSPAPESDPNGGPSVPTEIKRRKKKCPVSICGCHDYEHVCLERLGCVLLR